MVNAKNAAYTGIRIPIRSTGREASNQSLRVEIILN